MQFNRGRSKKLILLVGAAYSGIGGECGEACKQGKRACFYNPDPDGLITIKGQGMDTLRIDVGEWGKAVDAARQHTGDPRLPLWSAVVNYYGICIPSIVTSLSFTLWNLHQRISGTQNENYGSYYNLPAFWVDACCVIDAEIGRIDKVRADKAQHAQRVTMQNAGRKKHGNR